MTVLSAPAATAGAAPAATVAAPAAPGLAHLPLPLFASSMGLFGLGLAWREAAEAMGAPGLAGEALLALAGMVFGLVAGLQALRLLRHPGSVLAELRHPVRASFAGAATISLMLLAAALLPHAPRLADGVWALAVVLHLAVGVALLRRILAGRGSVAMLAPPLLIPLVGHVVAPIVAARLGHPVAGWALFGIGMGLWLWVQPLLLHRLLAGPPLPVVLRPSLAIMLAPPALGSLAAAGLGGGMGHPLALALLGLAGVVALVLLSLARELASAPFSLAWWGFTFPVSGFCLALMGAAPVLGIPAALPWLALAANTVLTGLVALRTLRAAAAGAFLRPEA